MSNHHYTERRNASSKKNEDRDCSVIAFSIAFDRPYDEVHAVLQMLGRKTKRGTPWRVNHLAMQHYCEETGLSVFEVTKQLQSKTTRTLERELDPTKTYIISVRRHIYTYRDGRVQDWSQNRCHQILTVWLVGKTPDHQLRSGIVSLDLEDKIRALLVDWSSRIPDYVATSREIVLALGRRPGSKEGSPVVETLKAMPDVIQCKVPGYRGWCWKFQPNQKD